MLADEASLRRGLGLSRPESCKGAEDKSKVAWKKAGKVRAGALASFRLPRASLGL